MTGRWDASFVGQVRDRNDIVEVVAESVQLRRAGREWVGRCPFHEDRTPSFHVSPERQVFHCFGCQAAGDVITFVMRRDGCDFREAVERLAARAGVPLPSGGQGGPQARALALLEGVAAFFESQLPGSPAEAYLRRRGVLPETARRFRLGYAPPDWRPSDAMRAAGVTPLLRGRLVFPICDSRGRVVAFGGRVLEGPPGGSGAGAAPGGKYVNSPGTSVFAKRSTWYGLHLAREAMRRTGRAIVVEGYMDVITAHQAGFPETVASLGTALSEEQAGILGHYAESILVAYDADAAGEAATRRGLARLQATAAQVRVVALPRGSDPDAFLRGEEGPAAFARLLDQSTPLVDYLFAWATAGRDVTRLEERLRVARDLVPVLAAIPDGVARHAYTEWVARQLFLDPAAYAAEVRNSLGKEAGRLKTSDPWHTRAARRAWGGGGATPPGRTDVAGTGLPAGPGGAGAGRRPARLQGPLRPAAGPTAGAGSGARAAADPADALARAQEVLLALAARRRDWAAAIFDRVPREQFAPGVLRAAADALAAALRKPDDGRAPGELVLDALAEAEVRERVAAWMARGGDHLDDPVHGLGRLLDDHQRLVLQARLDAIRRLERAGGLTAELAAEKRSLLEGIQRLRAPTAP